MTIPSLGRRRQKLYFSTLATQVSSQLLQFKTLTYSKRGKAGEKKTPRDEVGYCAALLMVKWVMDVFGNESGPVKFGASRGKGICLSRHHIGVACQVTDADLQDASSLIRL